MEKRKPNQNKFGLTLT